VSDVITARRDGFRLPVRLSGSGVPMVFLHGLGSDSADSRRDLGEPPGLRLALADQRGHGASRPAVTAGQFRLDDLADDLTAMIAELGWEQPVVGGGSMGAAVALRFALRDPRGCRALVLVAPAIGPDGPAGSGVPGFLADVAGRIEEAGLAAAVAGLRAEAGGAWGPEPMAPWLRQDGACLAVAMRAAASWRPLSSLADLAALEMPVALVGIEDDWLHPAGLARRMHASLPQASLELLPAAAAARPGAIGAAVRRGLAGLGVLTTRP
jgi:pimeloyl-ACP methyl ester carboxylesterase